MGRPETWSLQLRLLAQLFSAALRGPLGDGDLIPFGDLYENGCSCAKFLLEAPLVFPLPKPRIIGRDLAACLRYGLPRP